MTEEEFGRRLFGPPMLIEALENMLLEEHQKSSPTEFDCDEAQVSIGDDVLMTERQVLDSIENRLREIETLLTNTG